MNLLYGNNVGMRLKKLSLYSPSNIAFSAILTNTGLSAGGNLPLTSQFSVARSVAQSVDRAIALFTFLDSLLELSEHIFEFWMKWLLRPLSESSRGTAGGHSQFRVSFVVSLRRLASPRVYSPSEALQPYA